MLDYLTRAAEVTSARAAATLRERDIKLDAVVRRGNPRMEIVTEAESWGADLIVVGSHGRTGLKRWLMGSVAEFVVRHAPCSVEVVRERGKPGRRDGEK